MRERGGKAQRGWAMKTPFRGAWIMKTILQGCKAIKCICFPDITQLFPPAGCHGVEVSLTAQCILIRPECPECSVMFTSEIRTQTQPMLQQSCQSLPAHETSVCSLQRGTFIVGMTSSECQDASLSLSPETDPSCNRGTLPVAFPWHSPRGMRGCCSIRHFGASRPW